MPRSGATTAHLFITLLTGACAGSEPDGTSTPAASIVVTPDSASLLLFDTLEFVGTARDANGAVIADKAIAWRLEDFDDTTLGVVTATFVDSVGPSALVTAITFNQGTHVIATADGVEGRATLRTRANAASSVRIKPETITMAPGSRVEILGTFLDAQGLGTPVHPATWASSTPSVAGTDLGVTGTDLYGESEATLTAGVPGTTELTLSSGAASGSLSITVTPVRFRSVVIGGNASCALTTAGTPWCWGQPDYLGAELQLWPNPFSGNSALPIAVSGGHTFSSLHAGGADTCGLTAQGAAFCWGPNEDGLLFDTQSTERPVPGGSGESFTALAMGGRFICGLHAGGDVSCWGDNAAGALGDGSPPGIRKTPGPIAAGLTFSSLSATSYVCGLTQAGAAYCWGANTGGTLGNGDSTGTAAFSPVPVAGGLTFASIAAGAERTCALTAAGEAYCWGLTFPSEPGTPTAEQCRVRQLDSIRFYSPCHTRPTPVGGGLTFTQIQVGDARACALTAAGTVYCWGAVSWKPEPAPLPEALPNGIPFATLSIASSSLHACGVGQDGFVYCFGSNSFLESGVPDGTETVSPVRVIGQQ